MRRSTARPSVSARYLALGLLAFLPFFIATQTGGRAAVMSLAAIIAGGVAAVM